MQPLKFRASLSLPNRPRAKFLLYSLLILLGMVVMLALGWPRGSLWYDEALTAYVATDSWQTLIRWCTQVDIQVPFHYVVLRLWTPLVGDSEFTLHLLSALCVLLAVAGIIAAGRRLVKNGSLGLAAGVLLGAMPGMLWLGYEVRAYALALALYAWATAFLMVLIDPHTNLSRRRWIILIYALLMLAALYTHYTAIAGFAAHGTILLVLAAAKRSRILLGRLIVVSALVGVGFALWLPILLTRSAADRSYYVGDPIPPGRAADVMIGFKVLGREDAPPIAEPFVIGYVMLMIVGTLIAIVPHRFRNLPAALTGLTIAVWPVAITAALVYFKPKLAGRYAWPAWIGFDLLVGMFVIAVARWWRVAGIALLAIIAVTPWLTGELGHPPDSDFRAAYAYICTHGDPNDVIGLRDGTLFVVDYYYGRRPPCESLRYSVALPAAEMTNVEQALTLPATQAVMKDIAARHPPNVWVLSWQGDVMDPQALAYGLLDGTGDHTLIARMFGDVRLDRYEHPQPFLGDPMTMGSVLNVTPVAGGPTLHSLRILAPDSVRAGDVIVVQTWWTRGQTSQPGLRVSPRITTLDGGWTYTQIDQPPSAWKYVDDRWQPGIPVQGRYELRIGQDMLPGKYAVGYVIYDAAGRWPPIILNVGEIMVTG